MTTASEFADDDEDARDADAALAAHRARRDGELQVLRLVWEATPGPLRGALRAALRALHEAQKVVSGLSGHALKARPLVTNRELAAALAGGPADGRGAVYAALAELPEDAEAEPAELLCAIACWERGEGYLPAFPLTSAHPRWPDETDRAITLAALRDAGVNLDSTDDD